MVRPLVASSRFYDRIVSSIQRKNKQQSHLRVIHSPSHKKKEGKPYVPLLVKEIEIDYDIPSLWFINEDYLKNTGQMIKIWEKLKCIKLSKPTHIQSIVFQKTKDRLLQLLCDYSTEETYRSDMTRMNDYAYIATLSYKSGMIDSIWAHNDKILRVKYKVRQKDIQYPISVVKNHMVLPEMVRLSSL